MAETYNFTRIEINEHDFAAFLRRQKAIDNYRPLGASNIWGAPDGTDVALCFYDSGVGVRYWVRTDRLEPDMVIATTNASQNHHPRVVPPGGISTLRLIGGLHGLLRVYERAVVLLDLDVRRVAYTLGGRPTLRGVLLDVRAARSEILQQSKFTTDTALVLTMLRLSAAGARTVVQRTQALYTIECVADLVENEVYSHDFG